jgi:hypothetical protein
MPDEPEEFSMLNPHHPLVEDESVMPEDLLPSDTDEGTQEPSARPDLHALEQGYLTQEIVFPEFDVPVRDRWTAILQGVPNVRGRSLCEDLTMIYQEAWINASPKRLLDTLNLAMLQARFNYILMANHYIHRPAYEVAKANLWLWQSKLHDRLGEVRSDRRTGGRIRKGKKKLPKQPAWIH